MCFVDLPLYIFLFVDIPLYCSISQTCMEPQRSSDQGDLTRRQEEFRAEWLQISERANQSVIQMLSSDIEILPGLPNDLVLNHIWPRLRKDIENVVDVSLDDVPSRMKDQCSIAGTSKYWRCLITMCASWTAIKLLQQGGQIFGSRIIMARYYRRHLRHLPPIDAFSQMDLHKVAACVTTWEHYDSIEIETFLLARPKDLCDPEDEVGRFQAWTDQRSLIDADWIWLIDD